VNLIQVNQRTYQVNKRKRIMQSINQAKEATRQPSAKELNHSFTVVKSQLTELRKKLHTAQGEERRNIECEITTLLKSIGLEHVELEVRTDGAPEADTTSIGAKIAVALQDATTEAAKHVPETASSDAAAAQPGLWARFKAWVSANKKKTIAGGLAVLTGAAGLWLWLRGKNISTAVSSVSGMTEVPSTDTLPLPAETSDASIFARAGEWIVHAAGVVKTWGISAWNWVKGLFNRTTTATEVTVESAPEAVPAGA
jgi:hypothetical protein